MRIGIDLATRKIGICKLNDEGGIISSKTLTLLPFSHGSMDKNVVALRNFLSRETLSTSMNEIYVELTGYSNKNAMMFGFYAGVTQTVIGLDNWVFFIDAKE